MYTYNYGYLCLHGIFQVVKLKSMKKKTIIILTVIALFFAGVGAVVWWQFDNIKAIYYGLVYSSEDIEARLSHVHDNVKKYLDDNPQFSVRPTEPVEEELHKEGMINDEELTDIITGETSVEEVFGTQIEISDSKEIIISDSGLVLDKETAEKLKSEAKENEETESPGKVEKKDNSQRISECVAQMYVLKSNFVSRLDGLYNKAISDYNAMTPEQKKANGKQTIIDRYYSGAASMEAECDAKVSAVLSELTTLLKEQGSTTELVDKIKTAYYEEKSLKKAYYVSMLK